METIGGSRDNFETLWYQTNANKLAQTRARQAISQTGSALPCKVQSISGSLVTVTFECTFTVYQDGVPVTATLPPLVLPKAEAQWCRLPTQVGDFGITIPADTFLGAISGMGSGIASLDHDYGNLGTLIWIPIGSTLFTAMPNSNSPWLNGPAGAVVGDTAQTVYTLYDHTGRAVSHVVPGSGGLLGLGAIASTLNSARAVAAHADLDTLINDATNGVIAKTLQTLATAIGAASITAAMPNAAAFSAILSASGWVKGLSGITPTIPGCSSIVRAVS